MTNNWVQHNGDDALNIHSRWYEVVSIEGNRIQFRSEWLNRVRVPVNVGERLAFFDTDFSYKGYGTVIEDVLFDAQTETFTVALDEVPSSLAVFDKVHRVDHASRRFFVSDNTFGQNWARGAMIQASSGIVRTNRIFGNGIGGIVANMDYAYFKSAGPVVNVVIRNNNLLHSGTSLLSSRTLGVASTSMGSISLTTYVLPSDGYYVTFPIHRVVRINDNVVSRAPGIGIQVSSAKDVFVHDNVLEENNLFLPSRFNTGIETGRPADGSIYISDSSDVRLYDNEFIDGSRGVVVGLSLIQISRCRRSL